MNIKSHFKKECGSVFQTVGFTGIRGNKFIRYINGMLQVVEFQVSASAHLCEINWGVFPVSTKLASNDIFMCDHRLGEFENVFDWYEFDPKNDESIRLCISSLKQRIVKYLIPFFEKCASFNSAYYALCELEKATYGEILLADYSKGILAACFKDYTLSALHFASLYQQKKAAMVNNLKNGLSDSSYFLKAKAELDEIKRLAEYAHGSNEVALFEAMNFNRLHILQVLPYPILNEVSQLLE